MGFWYYRMYAKDSNKRLCGPRGLKSCPSLHPHLCFVFMSSEGSRESVNLCRFVKAFAAHISNTVKPVLSCHLKIDKTKVLVEKGSLMKVKSIAECSPWSILQ